MNIKLSLFIALVLCYACHDSLAQKSAFENEVVWDFEWDMPNENFVCSRGKKVLVLTSKDFEIKKTIKNPSGQEIKAIDIDTAESVLAFGDIRGNINLFDLNDEKRLFSIKISENQITSVCLIYSKNLVIAGDASGNVFIWNINSQDVQTKHNLHDDIITNIRAYNYSSSFVSSSLDGNMMFWNENLEIIKTISNGSGIRDFDISDDQKVLMFGSDNGKVTFLNIEADDNIYQTKQRKISKGWITAVDLFDNDGIYAIANIKGDIKVVTNVATYSKKGSKAINKLRVVSQPGKVIKLGLATLGDGMIEMNASNFKTKMY